MSIFKIVTALRAAGVTFTVIGDLLLAIGRSLRGENLLPRSDLQCGPDGHVSGSSSLRKAENEEPENIRRDEA